MNDKTGGIDEISVLQKQLAISLKFHHGKTLERIPLEVAVQVMASVWESCHPDGLAENPHDAVTAVIPKDQIRQAIHKVEAFKPIEN